MADDVADDVRRAIAEQRYGRVVQSPTGRDVYLPLAVQPGQTDVNLGAQLPDLHAYHQFTPGDRVFLEDLPQPGMPGGRRGQYHQFDFTGKTPSGFEFMPPAGLTQ